VFADIRVDRRHVLLAGISLGALVSAGPHRLATSTTGPAPVVGVLGSDARTAPDLDDVAGLDAVTLQAVWDAAQPTADGALDTAYVAQLKARISAYQDQGLLVVLDPGLQYAPSWVLSLPDALFVDQFGTAHTSTVASGEHVPDAVWNPQVRSAQAAYLAALATALGRDTFSSVRVGGLLMGELRLPRDAQGAIDEVTGTGSWWSFSRYAQSSSPVPGYRPGVSTRDADLDEQFLEHYLSSVAAYQDFLVGATTDAFTGEVIAMYPSYGVRPGDRAGAVAAGLSRASTRYAELVQGLDVERLVARLAAYAPVRAMAYSTWLDGPEYGTSDGDLSPVAHLAGLAAPLGIPVGGENTADSAQDLDALRLCRQRARDLGLAAVFWFNDVSVLGDADLARSLVQTFD